MTSSPALGEGCGRLHSYHSSFRQGNWKRVWRMGKGCTLIFMKAITQTEAINHIKKLLRERGLEIPSQLDSQRRVIFERNGKQLGIDSASGVWVREKEGDWHCLAKPCSVSGAIQAVEFLAKE